MKNIFVVLVCLAVVACSDVQPNQVKKETPVMVKLGKVQLINENATYTFPAEVDAVRTIDVSFEVSGRLVQQDIVTGTQVEQGHLLATIDQTPFIHQVKEKTSRKLQAERELNRIKQMIEKGLASQRDFDNAQTAFELAELELSDSQQELSYTQLLAPFSAQISERLVDNNSFVRAGQPIARMQDMSKIYFKINVPERVITSNTGKKIKAATATIGSLAQSFPVTYLEHSTTPDPITQTYKAVFAMEPIEGVSLVPGARAVLDITIEERSEQQVHVVPLSAVLGDDEQGFFVWKYNVETQRVDKTSVKVVKFADDFVAIDASLSTADMIVTAGASKMYQGLLVKPYRAEHD
ncbi:efflux RND transporter periplasmic adaptor subunit [Thalassotalea sp. LPB0316]|uniref:efflux RND transporter periplasmic adaptor subunit n=1 Tax=Thalassotalea sp. LPB0316 TaxID=2769490 RepID=UPI001868D5E1|nr:efflux RND transporter periplasmic adaptor subunit [Thalassotalea sp. LPB0316]QOL25319.1 efflux RND transporter periplasmic adaptor subunit [Thalassotalea sp. LPB0316]